MSNRMYFDVFPADDMNGPALGELSEATDKHYRAADNALGDGQFTINRHSDQYAWVAADNLVRVRLEAGGPFDYDDARYIGAFLIEEGSDTLVSPNEEGGEEVTRGGRTPQAILARAVIYPDHHHPDNAIYWARARKDGVVRFTAANFAEGGRSVGSVLRTFFRDQESKSPNPLAPLNDDFSYGLDSSGNSWTETDTDWEFPVGQNLLEVLGTLVSAGLYHRVSPALILSAWDDRQGTDLSGSISFEKEYNIRTSAERTVHARKARSRMLVRGTTDTDELRYREVIDAGLEAEINRREGYVEYGATPTNSRLDLAGQRAIEEAKNQRDGPTAIGVRDKPGNTAFVDYQPGDTVAVSIPEEWADLALRIYAISLDEDENNNGEYNPTLEFLESEWNGQEPGSLGQSEEPPGGGGGCRGCPPLEPYEPQPPDTTYDPTDPGPTAEVYLARPVHGAGPIEHENDGDSQPAGWSASPILSDMAYQGSAGARTGIIVNRDGRADVRVQMGANLVGSNPELHSKLFKNGAEIGQEVDTASGFGFHTLFTSFTVDVAFVAGDIFTVTAEVYNGGALETGVYGQVGGPATNHGTGLFLTDIQWALPPGAVTPPVPGQQGNEQIAGTTASTTYTTNYPYLPGSLRVTVDGISVVPDETDPAAGEFELLIDATGKTVVVAYVIASATGTGATNPPPDPDAPGGGSGLTVEEEGTPLATAATTLDFVGAGVTASGTGAEKTITIPGGPALSGSTPVQDGGAGAAGSGTDASKADHKHPGDYVGIEFVIDGNGDPITTGAKGVLKVPFACTITESELEADTASNTTVTIKKRAFGGGAASSIVAAALPTLSGGTEAKDSTLSGWTTSVAAGDKLYWEVTTNDNATRITSALSARRT